MRKLMFAVALAALAPCGAFAQATTSAVMTTADTPIGDLLDNPASKAVLEKNLPELVKSDQIDMARGMTLRAIQAYAPDDITDAKLAAVDADLAALKK
jgi:para-nitrobenzyl esterase